MRALAVLLLLLASVRPSVATCPSTPAVISYTPNLANPLIGVGVSDADYPLAFCQWAEADDARRTESRHMSLRPPASAALRSKFFGVDDCNDNSCTLGGGITRCLTIVNDSNAWEVVGCFGASSTGLGNGDAVTEFGLVCNGTSGSPTDDSSALNSVISAGTTAGRTIRISAGKFCALGSTVTMKSNITIRCDANAGFKAIGSITSTMLGSLVDVNNWTIDGCIFDLNSKSGVSAIKLQAGGSGTGGTPWHFWRNTVKNVGTGAALAYPLVRLDCTGGTGTCDVIGNTIIGSNTTATTHDTCLAVYASGAGFYGPAGTDMIGNHLQNCGENGLELLGAGGNVVSNDIMNVHEVGIVTTTGGGNPGQNADIIGNGIVGSNGCMKFQDAHNMNITSNQCNSGGAHGIWMVANNGGPGNLRNRIIGNYVVANIYLQSLGVCGAGCGPTKATFSCSRDADCDDGAGPGTCTASTDGCTGYANSDGNTILGNLLQAEGSGGAHRDPGVWIENPTNDIISNNSENALATTSAHDFIRLTQLTNTAVGTVLVTNNVATGGSGSGLHRCLVVEAPEVTGDGGGMNNLTLTGNSCGPGDVGIDLGTGTTAPGASSNFIARSNAVTQQTTSIVGFPGNFDTGFPLEDVLGQRGNLRNIGWQRDTGTSFATGGAGFKATGTSMDPVGLISSSTSVVSWNPDTGDPTQAFFSLFTGGANGDVGGWVWPAALATFSGTSSGIKRDWKPLVNMVMKLAGTTTTERVWCGFFSNTTATGVPAAANPSGISGLGFRYDYGAGDATACTGSTPCWQAWSNDGTTTGTTTGTSATSVAVDGTTRYLLTMDLSSGNDVKFYVNGTLIATRNTELPASGTLLGWLCTVTNLAASTHALSVASTYVEYPF